MLSCFNVITNATKQKETLSVRQLGILSMVYINHIHASVDHYARTLNLSKPAVTKALNRLEELRLVKRIPSWEDKRKITVVPTSYGQDYIQRIQANKLN